MSGWCVVGLNGRRDHLLRPVFQSQCTTWLCVDGTLSGSWTDGVCGVLEEKGELCLLNGDKLHATDNVRVVLETCDTSSASPGVIAKTVRSLCSSAAASLILQPGSVILRNVCFLKRIAFTCAVKCETALQGMVYVGPDVVGWRSIAKAWLSGRSQQQVLVSGSQKCSFLLTCEASLRWFRLGAGVFRFKVWRGFPGSAESL